MRIMVVFDKIINFLEFNIKEIIKYVERFSCKNIDYSIFY